MRIGPGMRAGAGTGRALRSIVEGLLLDLLYELPNRKDVRRFVVDAEVVGGRKSLAKGLTHEDLHDEAAAGEGSDPDAATKRESA